MADRRTIQMDKMTFCIMVDSARVHNVELGSVTVGNA